MTARVVIAAALSSVLMFVWGFIFWGPVLNMTARLVKTLPDQTELDVLAPLRAAQTPDGMYVYPGPLATMDDEAAVEAWERKLQAGPVIHMSFHQGGVSPMDPAMFAKGLAHCFVVALLAAVLLATAAHGLPTFASRLGVLLLATAIAALWTNVGNVIWYFHPVGYAGGQIAYTAGAGLLMALTTAAIVKPAPHAPAAAH